MKLFNESIKKGKKFKLKLLHHHKVDKKERIEAVAAFRSPSIFIIGSINQIDK